MALVNQQGTTVESIHALRTLSASSSSPSEKSPEREEEEEGKREQGHDCLNLEETLRIALQLLCILRQSGPVHDPATALLLLSCYSRLGAIFRDVFNCLQPILDQSGTSPWLLSRLFPHVQLGSVWLGDGGSSRLQAEMVLDASERFFADISTKMELFIDQSEDPPTPGKRGNSTPENRRSTIRDVLDEGIRVRSRGALGYVGTCRQAPSCAKVIRLDYPPHLNFSNPEFQVILEALAKWLKP